MSGPRYQCEQCGYDLTDVRGGDGGTRCPECGTHYLAAPYAMLPWPPAWRVALTMCGPNAGLVVFVVVCAQWEFLEWFLWIGWSILLIAWLMTSMLVPLCEAGELARKHAIAPRRRALAWQVGGGGLLVNLAASAVGLWALVNF